MKHTAHLDKILGYFEELQPNNPEELAASIRSAFLQPKLQQDLKLSVPGRKNLAAELYYSLVFRVFMRRRESDRAGFLQWLSDNDLKIFFMEETQNEQKSTGGTRDVGAAIHANGS